jgi:catechol-2,3-dioxygenase
MLAALTDQSVDNLEDLGIPLKNSSPHSDMATWRNVGSWEYTANGEPVEIKELGHLVLYVRNLDVSAHFYRDVLGWRELDVAEPGEVLPFPARLFSAPSNRTHHELLLIEVGESATPIPGGRRVGMYHFGLKIGDSDDELRAALQTLVDNNVTITGASDHTVTHSLYIQDPDGNEIELYVDVPGVDWKNNPALIAAPIKPLRL